MACIDHALIEELEQGDELRTEQVRAAAVVGERDERIERVEIALNRAIVGFKPPESGKNRTRNAISIFNFLEDIGIFDEIFLAFLQACLGNEALGKFGESEIENGLLAVAAQNFLVDGSLVQFGNAFSPTPASRASLVRFSIH